MGANVNDIEITLTVPEDTVMLNLDSTASLDTADLSAYVTTTAPYGYTLLMTASNSDLTRTQTIDGSYPTIPTLAQESTTVGFAANHWGYKLPSDSKFKPFDHIGTQVGYSDSAVTNKEETVTFAGKVNSNTPTGTYLITLDLAAVANSKPVGIEDVVYMQDFASASESDISSILASMTTGQSYPLTDSRDDQTYTIAKLSDGNIWMTKNLAIGCNGSGSSYGSSVSSISLTNSTSNVSSTWSTPTALLSAASSSTSTADLTDPRMQCNSTYGAWYNYAATTAGTVTGSPNSTEASYSICPAGWRLPTKTEQDNITSYITHFSPVTGGLYIEGSLSYQSYGNWWSSTAKDDNYRYDLTYDGSNLNANHHDRRLGAYVRCINS